ncbi:MAG: hypothetical protein L0177_00525 [Chloroflexi bacterium]|nr:hypothetical protein [Chloroflexota bacterium]
MKGHKELAYGLALIGVILVMIASFLLPLTASGNHGSVLHNALRQKNAINYGSYAIIEGTDPALNGGQWSYNRVASIRLDPNHPQGKRFGEIGWWKKSNGTFKGLIVWDYSGTPSSLEFVYGQGQPHSFMNWFEPNSLKWAWYYDGNFVHWQNLGFSYADYATCGGEVATGVEGMGNTRCGNGSSNGLLYMATSGGSWQAWNGHVAGVIDAPYQVVLIDGNNFRVKRNTE